MRIEELLEDTSAPSVKTAIKDKLDGLNMRFPSASKGQYDSQTLIRKKALPGGSEGPMTLSNAHFDRSKSVQERVMNALVSIEGTTYEQSASHLGGGLKNITFHIPLGDGKKERVLKFQWQMYPTYAGSSHDPSYQSYWYLLSSAEDKKITA